MQTRRPVAGATIPAIEPILTPHGDDCRRLRVVARRLPHLLYGPVKSLRLPQ